MHRSFTSCSILSNPTHNDQAKWTSGSPWCAYVTGWNACTLGIVMNKPNLMQLNAFIAHLYGCKAIFHTKTYRSSYLVCSRLMGFFYHIVISRQKWLRNGLGWQKSKLSIIGPMQSQLLPWCQKCHICPTNTSVARVSTHEIYLGCPPGCQNDEIRYQRQPERVQYVVHGCLLHVYIAGRFITLVEIVRSNFKRPISLISNGKDWLIPVTCNDISITPHLTILRIFKLSWKW